MAIFKRQFVQDELFFGKNGVYMRKYWNNEEKMGGME
jgi:hypothetical protein